ncbi:MAG: DapH/DapD/GlmU-related protein [Armatimonadota bacterium]
MQPIRDANAVPRTLVLLDGLEDRFRSRRPKWTHAIAGRAMLLHALGRPDRAACAGDSRHSQHVSSIPGAEAVHLLSDSGALLAWIGSDEGELVLVPADRPFCADRLREGAVSGAAAIARDGERVLGLRVPAKVVADCIASDAEAWPGAHAESALRRIADRVTSLDPVVFDDSGECQAIVDRIDLAAAEVRLRRTLREHWMRQGVTLVDPETVWIDAAVRIGPDTILLPGTTLAGNTIVGSECRIGPHVVATDVTIGDRCTVGPFANLRAGTVLAERVRIGNFVELKNALLGERVAAGHLSYLGDARVGAGTNIGAGVITCNYDGFSKHRTEIGDAVFVGSHTTLVAPVRVGDGALTAAGSVVTKDVPDDALAMGRARQENREGWAAARRERRKRSEDTEERP